VSEAETEKSSLTVIWVVTSLATEVALSLPSTGFVLSILTFFEMWGPQLAIQFSKELNSL